MPFCLNCDAPVEGKKVVSLSGETVIKCEHCGKELEGE